MNRGKVSEHVLVRAAATLAFALLFPAAAGAQSSAIPHEPDRAAAVNGTPSKPPDELMIGGRLLGHRVAPQIGDFCAIDKGNLHDDDPVYLIDGQRVALHWPQCYQAFLRDPQLILAQIRPRGAFLDAGENESKLSPAWFFAGVYVLAGLLFGALCAHLALHRGQNPAAWFAAGFVFNLVGYVVLLLLPAGKTGSPDSIPRGLGKFQATAAPVTCIKCGARNHPTARRCMACGLELTPAVESEVMRAGLGASQVKPR